MSLIGGAGSGKGNSQNRTDSTSSTTNTQTTVNQVDNRVYQSDVNALLALTDISGDAFNLGRDAIDANLAATNASLDNAQQAYGRSLDFAADITSGAFDQVGEANDRITRFAGDSVTGILDFARDLFGDALSAQSDLADQNVAGLTALATQNSASSEDRISKIVIYAIVAIAAAFILPKVIK